MKIIVKTQAELDALPLKFDECTEIRIEGGAIVELSKRYENAFVTACDSSQVRAYGSSQVRACDSSQVTACDSSQVRACDSSQVRACDSSQVTAYGSSQVTACDSSQVTAYGSSQVTAYGSSQVRACDSSQVTAYGSSQVTACGNSMIAVLSMVVTLIAVKQYAVVCLDGVKVKVPKKDRTATVIKRKLWKHTPTSFAEIHDLSVEDDSIVLFKSVREDGTDFHTGKIKYEGIVECPDWDGDTERECGGGLHLSPTKELALMYHQGKILRCKVRLKDIAVYSPNTTKVRCRRVEVLGPVEGEKKKP